VANPMPLLPPVMTAIFPASFPMISSSGFIQMFSRSADTALDPQRLARDPGRVARAGHQFYVVGQRAFR
jgi:hypothetical protein